MAVHQTGWTGTALVPCSHCNSNENGPEAGICHRGLDGSRACKQCLHAQTAKESDKGGGLLKALALVAGGYLERVPCLQCDGTGYRKI